MLYLDEIREDIYNDKLNIYTLFELGIHKVDIVKYFSIKYFDWVNVVTLNGKYVSRFTDDENSKSQLQTSHLIYVLMYNTIQIMEGHDGE